MLSDSPFAASAGNVTDAIRFKIIRL